MPCHGQGSDPSPATNSHLVAPVAPFCLPSSHDLLVANLELSKLVHLGSEECMTSSLATCNNVLGFGLAKEASSLFS